MPYIGQPELEKLIEENIVEERNRIIRWLNEGYPIDHNKNEDEECVCFGCYKRATLKELARMINASDLIVHLCDFAKHTDIRILCDQSYDSPDLTEPSPGIYGRYDLKLYTFNNFKVNCKDCLAKMKRHQ